VDYIQELQQKLNRLKSEASLRNLIDNGFYQAQPKIVELNIAQIEEHKGFDDKPLVNTIKKVNGKPKFPGTYSKFTQEFAEGANTSKSAGKPYDFNWYGDFLGNFELKAVGKGFATYSTGTGSGDKKEFFEGYNNMFGLNPENTATIESEVEYYVLEKILSEIYV